MSFSKEWDERFKANTHLSVWPWSDLVSYVMRYAPVKGPKYRVLELGCGAGANIPFFESLGVKYYAIEGSQTIVKRLWRRFPYLKDNIVIGDFTKSIPFQMKFNLIIDRGSLTHNTTPAIKKGLELVYENLKRGGKYIGIDWFSTKHSDYSKGLKRKGDVYTHYGYTGGHLANTGNVHFSDKQHLLKLFTQFEVEIMEHKIIKRKIPEDNFIFASWNIVAKKAK